VLALARLAPARAPKPPADASLAALLADARAGNLGSRSQSAPRGDDPGIPPAFDDDAERAGLRFVYQSGKTLAHQLPETMGGGAGLFDYDGDGFLDLYLTRGGTFPPDPKSRTTAGGDRLFRNKGDGTFEDATERAGIATLPRGYGHGVTVGDYDNDGRPDLFLTRWRSYALFRNKGDGTFEDVTDRAGLGGDRDWPTSAAFADLDGDGDLDLFVCHYVVWDEVNPRFCHHPETSAYTYCSPLVLTASPDHLFRNDGGRFVDVTREAGIVDSDGRGLGVVAADLDGDGRTDLYVANDMTANFLFLNKGNLRFEEAGHPAGVAGNAEGGYQGSMGIALGDPDGDGRADLAVTNFYNESTTFYRNLGDGLFADQTAAVGLAMPSRYLVGFGAGFLDFNNDGRLDLATANGHVNDFRPTYPHAMPCQLMAGAGGGRLVEVTARAGAGWTTPRIGRAMALGDLDNDGRVDALVMSLDSPLAYLHNRTDGGHSLTLRLEGSSSNRDALGARVTVRVGERSQTAWRFGGGSYQAASDPRLHFGLGAARAADLVEVRWPSGALSRFRDLRADAGYLLREGQAAAEPLKGFPQRAE
jgi:enediyne biosynthesis protein E4